MRWPPRTSSGRRTWSSWRAGACAGASTGGHAARWLEALPDELVRGRPVLSVGYAGALLLDGELEGVEDRLRDAERWLDTTSGPERRDRTPRRRRWSSWTRSFAVSRARSRCTVPRWPWLGAMCLAP